MPVYIILIVILVLAAVVAICATGYVKASPDTAYIISGFRKEPRELIGTAGIKIPFLEKKDELTLKLIPIDVKTATAVPTADYININVDAIVNVKVGTSKELLKAAEQNFLNKRDVDIAAIAREVLEGNTREIVGQMRLKEMVENRQMFAEKVKDNATPDLERMGLTIISFNVQNFVDDNGVIENLGVDNVVKIQKDAAISRATAEKDIAIAKAEAKKDANDAQVNAETEIAQRQTELTIKQAELKAKADVERAKADAAYRIQEEEQRKQIEITTANAEIAKREKTIEINDREVAIKEKALDAEIKKKAEADKYAVQQASEAALYKTQRQSDAELFERQKQAEAQKFEAEKQAEAKKAQAEADKYAAIQKAEAVKAAGIAEAEAIRAKGEAEAEAIKAKALAEAEGIEKKAEAMQKYGEAAMLEMYFKALPEVAKNVAEPLTKTDKITMYGDGNGSKLVGDIMTTIDKVSEGISGSTGLKNVVQKFIAAKKNENTPS